MTRREPRERNSGEWMRCYRSAAVETPSPEVTEAWREDVIILILFACVGGLGIGVGLYAPERTVELSLGLLMLIFALTTFVAEHRRRRGRAATRTNRIP